MAHRHELGLTQGVQRFSRASIISAFFSRCNEGTDQSGIQSLEYFRELPPKNVGLSLEELDRMQ